MSATATATKKPAVKDVEVNKEVNNEVLNVDLPNAGEVVPNVPTVSKLAQAVKDAKYQRSETLNELRTAKEYHANAIDEIDQMLADLGFPVEANGTSNGTPTPTPKPVTRGSGPRAGRSMTIADAVEGLLIKYEDGLSRADVTGKMLKEVEYQTKSEDPKGFADTIYTGGIYKLMTEKKIITVGKRPFTLYKHMSKATPQEIADFNNKGKE